MIIETKYNINDELFASYDGKKEKCFITNIDIVVKLNFDGTTKINIFYRVRLKADFSQSLYLNEALLTNE